MRSHPVGLRIQEGTLGRSFFAILTGAATPHRRRDFVHCEYADAADLPKHTFATIMARAWASAPAWRPLLRHRQAVRRKGRPPASAGSGPGGSRRLPVEIGNEHVGFAFAAG
jgi:hypothetical protein